MPPESNLDVLLSRMAPLLHPTEYVFCSMDDSRLAGIATQPIGIFRESEGVTAILPREDAGRFALEFSFPCRMITLSVHSSLEAVGFLARIAAKLAGHGIGVNVVSGYYHDHLFVPLAQAEQALRLLQELQSTASAKRAPRP